ncbi:MAG: DUF5103 domain-containing protein, partial [Flavobacteriaceae bacterium]|nr:DUF5103 domain-containing protein [Flavobacteriaceae bacterium]
MIKNFWILLLISSAAPAQQEGENIYNQDVKTVQLFNTETNDETPFIRNDRFFILSFDILNQGYQRLSYSVKHCDRNWNPDNLFDSEYVNGYTSGQIREAQPSFNTVQNYYHYTLQFPNQDMQVKVSGNYLLTVFDDRKKPLFSKRFSVYEPVGQVGIGYERVSSSGNPDLNQRVSVKAAFPNGNSMNVRQLSLCILRNNNWENALCGIQPQFINGNNFTFGQLSNVFDGGNEFFSFDTKNISVQGYGVLKITKDGSLYNTFLYPVIPYPLDYAYNPDVNGAYYVRRFDLSQERDGRTEGDYTYVNFAVNMTNPLEDKDLYVVGLFNNYQLTDENKMIFDEKRGFYEKTILLKQGYYNYTIATLDRNSGKVSYSEISGSFWQTENLYQG